MTAPKLAFDTSNGRYYRHPGNSKTVPSITNIKNMKHVALDRYAAKKVANYAADNREKLATLDRNEAFTLCREALFAKDENSPSRIGDIVHGWIEEYVRHGARPDASAMEAAPITARRMWGQFTGFTEKYRPVWTATEFTVWSYAYGYAGTADLSFYIGDSHVLCDTKTGANIYPDTAMQLAALGKAEVIVDEQAYEKPLPHFDKHAILHLRPMSATLVPVYHIDEWFQAFLGLKQLFDVVVEYNDTTLGYAPQIKS